MERFAYVLQKKKRWFLAFHGQYRNIRTTRVEMLGVGSTAQCMQATIEVLSPAQGAYVA